ncbi:DUF882 domain-containing protein [Hyphomicrobium sp.]|uniref:DUF882 domain-containing protein n=1 Tax=Hyphomicrobium sp. TaxID=82 RepID=UPI003F6FF77B
MTCRLVSAAATATLALIAQVAAAQARDDRTISFYHIHTKETLTVLYKKDGRFVPDALEKINWIMRDWRVGKSTPMDPNTVDIIWEMHRELGSQQPVNIICGYRSPSTNEMLRRTRGGQASQSQHMTGKAIDLSFPDVPIKRMRYSAMIRERGGVGYYPTSGIPFVHVDTSRVRHWPRMLPDELAILFPNGSKHGSVSPAAARAARERRKDIVQEVAQFMDLHNNPKAAQPVLVAEAAPTVTKPLVVASLPQPPMPTPAVRPPQPHQRMAVGGPQPTPADIAPEKTAVSVAALPPPSAPAKVTRVALNPAVETQAQAAPPKLLAAPAPVDKPSKFVRKLPDADRSRLDMLVTLASLEPEAQSPPPPAASPVAPTARKAPAPLVTGSTPIRNAPIRNAMTASMTPDLPFPKKPVTGDAADPRPAAAGIAAAEAHPFGEGSTDWRSGWVAAPEYDEDHPEELSYRPFALAPLLTETPSFDDPALQTLVRPDPDMAIAMIDDEGVALPMRLGAGHQQTAMAWAQEFRGDPVYLDSLAAAPSDPNVSARQLVSRSVKTR